MIRVAFVGPAKSGKSIACKFLANKHGGRIASFAEPLKVEIVSFLQQVRLANPTWKNENKKLLAECPPLGYMSYPPVVPNGESFSAVQWVNKHKDELRPLLQWWGTDYRRQQNLNYWIDQMELIINKSQNVFIDDCRFLNEAEFLLSKGFILVGIDAEKESHVDYNHPSELGVKEIIEKFNLPVIKNTKTNIDQYWADVMQLVEELQEAKAKEEFDMDVLRFGVQR